MFLCSLRMQVVISMLNWRKQQGPLKKEWRVGLLCSYQRITDNEALLVIVSSSCCSTDCSLFVCFLMGNPFGDQSKKSLHGSHSHDLLAGLQTQLMLASRLQILELVHMVYATGCLGVALDGGKTGREATSYSWQHAVHQGLRWCDKEVESRLLITYLGTRHVYSDRLSLDSFILVFQLLCHQT